MAAGNDAALMNQGVMGLNSQLGNKLLLVVAAAAVVAVMAVFWLWSQQPDYRVLFSNYSDKDGGSIVAALEKMNVPYKFSDSGTAILVPAAQVHQARLKLASEGLPKGGNIGFELLENQKFGVSQFVEQVNFQRALEGELERSIQSIGAVEVARIHLAIPKASVFVRDQQKPTASVLLNLRGGRSLDAQQVGAVVHLVASSVPNLPAANVTVVDQNGNLLSDTSKKMGSNNLDPTQLKYIEDIQQSIVKRVESIITPIVGAKNVRAEASAEIDFSSIEQAAESYKPNQKPDDAAIRSLQSNESLSSNGAGATGVPGALSNQPPANATAPLTTPEGANSSGAAADGAPVNNQKNIMTNYEVDKTVRYSQQGMGGIKRLNVAVVVNNMPVVDKAGKVTYRPLTEAEKTQINDLAMQAMGFNKERGDALAVVNSSFAGEPVEIIPEVPLWKNPEVIEYGKDALRFIVGIVVLIMIYKRALSPMLRKLTAPSPKLLNAPKDEDAVVNLSGEAGQAQLLSPAGSSNNLAAAKQLAKDNPRMVASVVANWTSGNE
ncbi:flagellar basal-body MS-ring/collar protein FliF [Methylotenera sp.]|uniref:flagellar basal-body MS-ring/collar protein FliF n=2 Tax=Methylotenera sp. TaxID=2051956 RepID=UPI00273146D5|nr:flagellar basal-body MS-ring/collar protein FliF [Methylotenera sp.]MDP1522532.1 flagellar basal-body MS-ring/collar protein FliF [Methylotenera sp.]MDP2229820.1 flagellar basal-body MS-ring/collar protein FliF [Methylotenera sp.]MDP3818954.1 flagellar basal-body MS-ring/collar protein FliF [Methylotenera sp.]